MRIAKWILIGLGGLLALAALAILVLTQFIDPARFKGPIERQVAAVTGRDFRLTGDIELSFFPWLALTTGAAQLPAPAGFADPRFLAWQDAHVGVRLLPLLRGELVVDRVRLAGLDARLVKAADGRVNWAFGESGGDSEGEDGEDGEGEKSGGGKLPDIAGIELRDARVTYVDEAAGTQFELAEARVDIEPLRSGAPLRIDAAGIASKAGVPERIAFELQSRIAPGPPVVVEEAELTGTLRDGRFGTEGVPWRLAATRINYDTATGALDAPEWQLRFDDAQLSGALAARLGDTPVVEGQVRLAPVSLRETLAAAGIVLPPTRDKAAYDHFEFAARFELSGSGFTVSPLDIRLDDTRLGGRIAREASGEGLIRFELRADRMDVDRYLKPAGTPSEPFVFPADALKALRAEGTLAIDEATLEGVRLRGVRFEAATP